MDAIKFVKYLLLYDTIAMIFEIKTCCFTDGLLAVDISSSRTSSSHCPSVSPERERPIHSTHSHPLSNSTSISLDHATAAREMLSHHGPSSIETLLTNIQGLLKVAADNARQQEKHIHLERGDYIILAWMIDQDANCYGQQSPQRYNLRFPCALEISRCNK